MKRLLPLCLALFALPSAARAQAGVYAMFDAQQFNRTGLLASPPAGSSNSDSPWLYGTSFGAFYTITHLPGVHTLRTGPVTLGIDGRGTFVRTNTAYNRDDGLFSIRVSTKDTFAKMRPYVQGGFGVGHTRVPGQLSYTNNFSYLFAVGADRKITKLLDWRVVDISGGFLGNYVAGSNVNDTNRILNFASGIVVRFP